MRFVWLCFASMAVLGGGLVGGCGGDDGGGKTSSGGSGGGGTGGGASECTPTDASCYATGAEGPGNECMAKADFSSGAIAMLRMTSHQVQSPSALAAPFVQDSIITKKSALVEPNCNLDGSGQFNFLMQLDTDKKELTLGGGVPQALIGSAIDGTCWAAFKDPASGLEVKQYVTPYTESGGQLEGKLDSFVMPIFLADKAGAEDAVLVPLHEMTFTAKLSADKNCVGRYAAEKLSKGLSCQPTDGEFAWEPAGRYEGYITVEEADDVMVVSLGESLCVVLSGDTAKWKGTAQNCATSKGFAASGALPKGDWCAATNSAGGCQDSWKLVIDFAAQAINIKGVYDATKGGC
ncbi:MAG: hypothetical protein IPI67_18920 [Myxococcales bacterium]|nr:hypothetical protein [Myxococcales bacterium]